jgi:hypothetical protein
MMRTLLLMPWMAPHKVIGWERAVTLVVLGKVDVLEEYDEAIRAQSFELRTPAVVRLKRAVRPTKHVVRFSRINVYTRDDFRLGEHRHLLLRVQRPQGEPHPGGGGHDASPEAVQAVEPPSHAGPPRACLRDAAGLAAVLQPARIRGALVKRLPPSCPETKNRGTLTLA